MKKFQKINGYSLVEALLGIALFAIIAAGLAGSLSYGYFATFIAGARTRATFIANEGLEATRNIKENAYTNLADGTYGLISTGNTWSLSGSSDTTDSLFNRQITITDAPGGNRKQITSTVTWPQTDYRNGSVSLVTYLSNWSRVGVMIYDAMIIYGDGTTTPKYRTYSSTSNTFSTQTDTIASSSGLPFTLRTSPNSNMAIAGFVTNTGVLNVLCFNGTSWSQEWTATVGGTGLDRRFDIAYETASGDALVLYSTNTGTTNELAYRTLPGGAGCGNWSTVNNFNPSQTSGIIQYIRLAWDRRSGQNLIAANWIDANDDLSAAIWSGTSWTNEPGTLSDSNVQRVAASHDIENLDIEYESTSGDVMIVWGTTVGNNTNGVRYRTCTGGTSACTWSAVTTPPTFVDDATTLDISANQNTDEIIFASIGRNQSDLQLGYWSGTAWTNTANADTSCNTPVARVKYVTSAWLVNGATTRAVVAYGDQGANKIDWYTANGSTFTKQTDFAITPAPKNPNGYYQMEENPLSKEMLMECFSDSNNDLFCKRLVMSDTGAFTWTNSDGAILTGTLPQNVNRPYSFAFKRY